MFLCPIIILFAFLFFFHWKYFLDKDFELQYLTNNNKKFLGNWFDELFSRMGKKFFFDKLLFSVLFILFGFVNREKQNSFKNSLENWIFFFVENSVWLLQNFIAIILFSLNCNWNQFRFNVYRLFAKNKYEEKKIK